MFKVWNDSDAGYQTHIVIDGVEVSEQFNSLTITAGIKTAVQIELDMPIVEQGRFEGEPTKLVFPVGGSRELLIKHGWTPPADD